MEIPKPTLSEAIDMLNQYDEFKVLIQFMGDERERFFTDLRGCESQNEVMKIVGSISTIDEFLSLCRA